MVWNADPELLSLSFLHVRWYGVLFALAFFSGREVMIRFFNHEKIPTRNIDTLLGYMMVGTVLGARVGHCLFYEPAIYLHDPIRILKIWEGGLASHGAFVGIMIALGLYYRKHREMPLLSLMDRIAIPIAWAGFLIRMGNFFNSEILGKPTDVPWAIVFSRVDQVARHPAQLYESIAYLLIFVLLFTAYWKTSAKKLPGFFLGSFLVLVFFARFVIEFFKENQVQFESGFILNMGQLLSIPLVLLGLYLIWRALSRGPQATTPRAR